MVNCPYKGDGTMIKRTYEIWQISAETILANAKQREDGTYRIHFDIEKAVHNESVRKTEQPQCALFDQIEHIFNEPDFPETIRGLRRMEWHIVYVDFSGIFDRAPVGKTAELQKRAEAMFRPEGITLEFPYSRWQYYAFERSASMSRVSRLTFVSEYIYEKLKERITLGMRFDQCVLSKVYAYNGLMFTDGYRVSTAFDPKRMIVVDDFESTQRNVRMITVEDDGGEGAERSYRRVETVGALTVKEFDGEGLISREFAAFVDDRCGFRHIHSSFQIRMPYIKGVLHEVDFHSLFKELDVPYLIDIWGNRHPVNEVDMILTKSMFKAFGWMTDNGLSWKEYLERCEQYGHFLYISQFNTVKVPTQVDMNYQFLATVSMTQDEFRPTDLPGGWDHDPNEDPRNWLTKESESEYYRLVADPKSRMEYFTSVLDDPEINPLSTEAQKALLLVKNPLFINEPVYTDELKKHAESVYRDFAQGHLLIRGENRYLSGDLMRFLLYLAHLTADHRKASLKAVHRLSKECLLGTVAYAPGFANASAGQVTILRNPHIARNEEVIIDLLPKEGILRRKYLSHLTYVVMVNAKSLIPERLGGADYDGDIVKVISDPLINACVRRHYAELDYLASDYSRNLPLLKIPSVSAKESDANDWHARFETVRDTFASRVGQICNAAFNRAVVAYDESLPETEREKYREETELLAILTGLEIDAAKNGVRPDISQYLRAEDVERSLFLDYKDLVEGKRGKNRKGWKIKRFHDSILWEKVTSNIERLPHLAAQLKKHTPKVKAVPALDQELFAFATDPNWRERLPAKALEDMRNLISDYETALKRIRTERMNLNYMTRKKDIGRILFARAQTDVSIESLYAAFVECTEEEFRNARAALKEQQWHLIRDPYQRELFLFGQFRHMQFYEFKSILTDFRCGGYRILGDIICDYDDFYRKRGVKQARLRREDDSADLRVMLDGEDLLYRSNYKAEIRHRCRERLRSRLDTNLALRCAIALGKRKFALDVLNLEVYENALERTEQ